MFMLYNELYIICFTVFAIFDVRGISFNVYCYYFLLGVRPTRTESKKNIKRTNKIGKHNNIIISQPEYTQLLLYKIFFNIIIDYHHRRRTVRLPISLRACRRRAEWITYVIV
jgi:hypothetical protein